MVNEKGYEIVKFVDGELEMEVNISPQENTVWLNQKQLATLFKVNTQAITKQLSNIYSNQE